MYLLTFTIRKTSFAKKFHQLSITRALGLDNLNHRSPFKKSKGKVLSDCDVVSVVLSRMNYLGIKIQRHKILSNFYCVQSFELTPDGTQSELELDGRIAVGDLLIAINSFNLVNLNHNQIKEILLNSQLYSDHTVLTFIRSDLVGTDSETSSSSCSDEERNGSPLSLSTCQECDEETESEHFDVKYLDSPIVHVYTSYFVPSSKNQSCLVELVDIPGNDENNLIALEWLHAVDGIILMYSSDSEQSLFHIQNTYASYLVPSISKKDIYNIPIVVVCTQSSYSGRINTSANERKRALLVSEGKNLADAWNAPFFLYAEEDASSKQSHHFSDDAPTVDIVSQVIQEIQLKSALSSVRVLLHSNTYTYTSPPTHTPSEANPPSSHPLPRLLECLPFVSECLDVNTSATSCVALSDIDDMISGPSPRKMKSINSLVSNSTYAPFKNVVQDSIPKDLMKLSLDNEPNSSSESLLLKHSCCQRLVGLTHEIWMFNALASTNLMLSKERLQHEKELARHQIVVQTE